MNVWKSFKGMGIVGSRPDNWLLTSIGTMELTTTEIDNRLEEHHHHPQWALIYSHSKTSHSLGLDLVKVN